MALMKLLSWRETCSFLIFLFGVLFCHYTGNRGIFPIDSFSHYDSGYRILNGEHPFRDYWIVSGFFIDYVQSIIFYLFGTDWQIYILNASILNGLVTLFVYKLFNKLGLDFKSSFFYAICFTILAYPSSGTPFVDHHSTLLSLVAIIFLILAFEKNKIFYWSLVPVFLFFAFLSKQVPATYIFLVIMLMSVFHFTHQSKKDFIKIIFILTMSSIILIVLLILFFYLKNIDIKFFITQYIYYPTTIGEERFKIINHDLKNSFLNFKFIYLALFFLSYFSYKNLKENGSFYKDIDFKILLICIFSFIAFAQHIILTKNQIFIFFLIPFFLGFANIQLNNIKIKYKKYFRLILIIFCVGATLKYHIRFNLERKFHELNNVKFTYAIDSKYLSKKFRGLKWVTPNNKNENEVLLELEFLRKVKKILKNETKKKIVLTNYSFFSVLTNENISGYSRWYPGDNSAFPIKGSKHFESYRNFIVNILNKKKIEVVYILPDVKENNLLDYLDFRCFKKEELELKIVKYEINDKCNDFFIMKIVD